MICSKPALGPSSIGAELGLESKAHTSQVELRGTDPALFLTTFRGPSPPLGLYPMLL